MSLPTEVTPLLNPVYPESDAETREDLRKAQTSRMSMFGEELKILLQYTSPIFGYVIRHAAAAYCANLFIFVRDSTHISEYALVIIPVIFIGHDSTTGLAAFMLASMFAMITGFSIVNGFLSSLDTVLPSTWTSAHPKLAALWTQRLGKLFTHYKHSIRSLKELNIDQALS
jgi:MATE family multidrug resistance protein